jgi:hypothetical protein
MLHNVYTTVLQSYNVVCWPGVAARRVEQALTY